MTTTKKQTVSSQVAHFVQAIMDCPGNQLDKATLEQMPVAALSAYLQSLQANQRLQASKRSQSIPDWDKFLAFATNGNVAQDVQLAWQYVTGQKTWAQLPKSKKDNTVLKSTVRDAIHYLRRIASQLYQSGDLSQTVVAQLDKAWSKPAKTK